MPLRMTEDSVGSGIDQGYLRLTNMKRAEPEFIVCVDNSEYPTSLELRKLYSGPRRPSSGESISSLGFSYLVQTY